MDFKWLRFAPPVFMFILTYFLTYLCFTHSIFFLFSHEYYLIVIPCFAVFTFSMTIWIWSFFNLMFGDPGDINEEMKHVKMHNCTRWCPTCKSIKPYRTHHCKTCGKCYAHMDHHCAVIGKCVAIRNTKIFLVFLFHSIILTTLYFIFSLCTTIVGEFGGIPSVLIVDLFGSSTLTIILVVLFVDQIMTLLSGRTTLEYQFKIEIKEIPPKWETWKLFFGEPAFEWILPTPTPYSLVNAVRWENLRPVSKED